MKSNKLNKGIIVGTMALSLGVLATPMVALAETGGTITKSAPVTSTSGTEQSAVPISETETSTSSVSADSKELFKTPVFVYGGGLSPEQQAQVKKDLKIKDSDFKTEKVEGVDVENYLKLENVNTSGLFSSVYILHSDREGQNIVKVLTPENITLVTESGYRTPLVTAGVSNIELRVASPTSAGKVSGESALSGVYKALEQEGVTLDGNKVEVAQEELATTAGIVDSKGGADMSYEDREKLDTQLASALTDIKTQLAKIQDKQVTDKQIEDIVNKALKNAGIKDQLDQEDIDQLIKLANMYIEKKDSVLDDASIERYKAYAKDVADTLKDKWGQATSEGGWLSNAWNSIKDFFSGLFNKSDKQDATTVTSTSSSVEEVEEISGN